MNDGFRTLEPTLIERHQIAHPDLPEALDGLTVLHLSDLHVRRHTPRAQRYQELLHAIEHVECDIVALTGDYMDAPGQEHAAIESLRELTGRARARSAVVAVYGNHDTPRLRALAPAALPGVMFLDNQRSEIQVRGTTQEVLGLSYPEDVLLGMKGRGGRAEGRGGDASKPRSSALSPRPFLTLAHHPTCLIACAAVGLPIVLAGHTHAGQIRVSAKLAPHTSSDVPSHLATGLLRLGNTVMAISRGVGDGVVEGLRLNCPRQVGVYTLRRGGWGAMPGADRSSPDRSRVVTQTAAW